MTVIKNVIMPVLGMSQETGTIVKWLAGEGQYVRQGDPLMEIETDKAVVDIEAGASGYLSQISVKAGESVAVGSIVAVIVDSLDPVPATSHVTQNQPSLDNKLIDTPLWTASPVAARMAAEYNLELRAILPQGGRVEKADVLAYIESISRNKPSFESTTIPQKYPASPKARRLAAESGLDIKSISGSGPHGAILASDVSRFIDEKSTTPVGSTRSSFPGISTQSTAWRIMAEHTTASWTTAPHFYLMREVDASRLISWRAITQKEANIKITYSDLLVRLTASALTKHTHVNALVQKGIVEIQKEINLGLAVAIDNGLVVPVIKKANELSIKEIAAKRALLVEKAQHGKLHPEDISGGTFTISNLGMFGVDAFQAILNSPQAAILAVGRIADRVVPYNGAPAIRPMMVISVSFDHRAIDGARGASFLDTLARLIEEPMGIMEQ